MKIVYIIPHVYVYGGVERILCDKSNAFVDKGIEVHFITYRQEGRPSAYEFNNKVKFHHIDLPLPSANDNIIQSLFNKFSGKTYKKELTKAMNDIVNMIDPDILISVGFFEQFIIHNLDKKCITLFEKHSSRTTPVDLMKSSSNIVNRIKKAIIKKLSDYKAIRIFKRFDRFITLTSGDLNNWPELSNTVSIPNFPHPVETILNEEDFEVKRVIAVGRLVIEKRYEFLVDAWSNIVEKYPEWKLSLYGDGPLRGSLQAQIDSLDLSQHVILEGARNNINQEYLNSSIMVMSSWAEGMPLVILEAMQHKLPIVSVACGNGVRELIDHGKTGLLVEDMDNPAVLAENIMSLMESEEKRKTMGLNGFEKSKSFSKDVIIDRWIALFEQLIAEKRAK